MARSYSSQHLSHGSPTVLSAHHPRSRVRGGDGSLDSCEIIHEFAARAELSNLLQYDRRSHRPTPSFLSVQGRQIRELFSEIRFFNFPIPQVRKRLGASDCFVYARSESKNIALAGYFL
ncbi:hypothetical protein BST61_g5949 [Cercospora zeina]